MSYLWIEPAGPTPPKFCAECGGAVKSTDRVERISVPDRYGRAVACYRKVRVVRAWCPVCEPGEDMHEVYP